MPIQFPNGSFFTGICLMLTVLASCNSKKTETAENVKTDSLANDKEFVFGDNRPFAQCHASTLVRLDDAIVYRKA